MTETRTTIETRQEQRQVTETVKLEILENSRGEIAVLKNGVSIAGDDDTAKARYADILLGGIPRGGRIAVVGGGTLILPRLLVPYNSAVDVYEIEPALVAWAQERYPTGAIAIIGDYRQTMESSYDLIIYDIDSSVFDRAFLEAHLNPGGKLVTVHDVD